MVSYLIKKKGVFRIGREGKVKVISAFFILVTLISGAFAINDTLKENNISGVEYLSLILNGMIDSLNSSYQVEEVTEEGLMKDKRSEVIINKSSESDVNLSNIKIKNKLPSGLLNKIQKDLWDITEKNKSKVIIQLKKEVKPKLQQKIKKGKYRSSLDDKLLFAEVDGDEISSIVEDEDVVKIWPDLETQAFLSESVEQINAGYLWSLNLSGSGIKIAILDTGIDADHEMLSGRVILQQDFTNGGSYDDVYGHGTHVTGIAAGDGYYKGVGFGSYILNGKVLDNSGSGQLSWLINGIDWAIQNNVDVISLSLGAVYSGNPEDQLNSPEVLKVQEAIDNVVIASGNCGSGRCGSLDSVTTPGIARNAITVGAVNRDNTWADFSSGGYIADYIKPDLVAPGVGICSSIPNGYDCFSGTSMATPHVSGSVALLLENNSSLTPNQVKNILESNTLDLGDEAKDIKYGSGLLNLENILNINLEHVTNETEPENYKLIVSAFEVGKTNSISLEYFNKDNCTVKAKAQCKPKKITVTFDLEELDRGVYESITKTIPVGKSKEFKTEWTPTIIGKHLLKIDIFDEANPLDHIETAVDVSGVITNEMDEVMLLVRK